MYYSIRICQKSSMKSNLNNINYVVEHSKHVKINKNEINKLSDTLDISKNEHLFIELSKKYSERKMLIFLLLCESINFCYWLEPNWKIEYENNIYKGSIAMFLSMKKYFESNPEFFETKNLINLKYSDFCNIFKSIDKPLPLLKERYKNFMETVKILNKKQENFYNEIYSFNSDLEMLEYVVKTFPSFNDYTYYKLKKIKFYKRANLLIRDYFELIPTIKKNLISISNLYACADYIIPNMLRECGILEYSNELEILIDSKKELKHNSIMEIEIRANMIIAIELIKQELIKKNIYIDSVILDSLLWNYGKKKVTKFPHHRTTTIYY